MREIPRLSWVLFAAVLLAACQQPAAPQAPTTAQAQDAIRAHLTKRGDLAMNNMDIQVLELTQEGEEYIAETVFRAKAGAGEMPMNYRLRHDGNGWVVAGPAGSGTHQNMPEGHPKPGSGAESDPAAAH